MGKHDTKKPTGLGIELKAKKFTFTWKIGDKNYGGGQELYYVVNITNKNRKKNKTYSIKKYFGGGKNKASIGAKVTKKTTPAFNWDDYEPKKAGVTLNYITFYVRGKKAGKKSKWSPWEHKTFNVQVPPKASFLNVSLSSDVENQCTFFWGYKKDPKAEEIRSYWQYRTGISTNGAKFSYGKWTDRNSGSVPIKENITFKDNYSYKRYVQVRACGPQGVLKHKKQEVYVTKSWTYAFPNPAQNVKATAISTSNGAGYKVNTHWTAANSATHPIDLVTVEYATVKPNATITTVDGVVTTTLSCPENPGWTQGGTYKDNPAVIIDKKTKKKSDYDGLVFTVDKVLNSDECMFARVNTYHTPKTSYGYPVQVVDGYGPLLNPTLSEVEITQSTNIAKITATNNSQISASFLAVYYRTSAQPNATQLIGIMPSGVSTVYVKLPEAISGNASIGVQAYVGNYSPAYTPASGASAEVVDYKITKTYMSSPDIVWQNDAIAPAPNITLRQVPNKSDTVRVAWDWTWPNATEAEISWADHDDAWESTNEPSTYIVNSSNASEWNVSGLAIGTWYFRVRLRRTNGDTIIYGAYSSRESIKLASSPATPALWPTSATIPQDGSVTLNWAYTSTDGTGQLQGEMCEATINDDGTFEYGKPFVQSGTAQHITVSAEDRGWTAVPGENNTHYVAVRVISASNETSEGWSVPVPITIAEPPTITEITTSLKELPVTIDDETQETTTQTSLTELPFTIDVSTPVETGSITYIIERATDYHVERPDESEFDGYTGETIAILDTTIGSGTAAINKSDLIGHLDDGAKYNLIVIVEDEYGQTTTNVPGISFFVHWTHQAILPEAEISVDDENQVVMITPLEPRQLALTDDTEIVQDKKYYSVTSVSNPVASDLGKYYEEHAQEPGVYTATEDEEIVSSKIYYIEQEIESPSADSLSTYYQKGFPGDTCDIYRLSVDKPELIVENATFGTTYVDPYPTLGVFGGHRVAYKTINDDFIIGDNTLAISDYAEDEGDIINQFAVIISFGDDSVTLPYDVKLSNSWTKDFIETKYLGGSIQGDWNPAVSRSTSVSTTSVVFQDPETIELMRRLAVYPGICHVRTPDGSSFSANVSVSEDRDERKINKIANFSLSITKIDSQKLDGITYTEWMSRQEE